MNESITSGVYPKGKITLDQIIHSIKTYNHIKNVGSIHTFSGIVRATSKKGAPVLGMKIDAYVELANKSINKICNEIKEKKGIIS